MKGLNNIILNSSNNLEVEKKFIMHRFGQDDVSLLDMDANLLLFKSSRKQA